MSSRKTYPWYRSLSTHATIVSRRLLISLALPVGLQGSLLLPYWSCELQRPLPVLLGILEALGPQYKADIERTTV